MKFIAVLCSGFLVTALSAAAAPPPPVDYSNAASWLCQPGRADACAVTLSSTVVTGAGTLSRQSYAAAADAPVDCFYVYPTVSREPRGNADLALDPEIHNVAVTQFARFSAKCRTYAPLYRQTTVAAMSGETKDADAELPYHDIVDAWHYYLKNANHGRGVVLIGHSQGATLLTRLVADEIDGRKEQSLLLSALLIGTRIAVPAGRDVGGYFKHIPLCHAATDLHCVIGYSSYLATDPPGADAIFGAVADAGVQDACVNPSALLSHRELDAELPTVGAVATALGTDLVENPGAYHAQCTTLGNRTFLAISIESGLPNAERLQRSLAALSERRPGWGLHVFDVNLALGDLVEIVGREAQAYVSVR